MTTIILSLIAAIGATAAGYFNSRQSRHKDEIAKDNLTYTLNLMRMVQDPQEIINAVEESAKIQIMNMMKRFERTRRYDSGPLFGGILLALIFFGIGLIAATIFGYTAIVIVIWSVLSGGSLLLGALSGLINK